MEVFTTFAPSILFVIKLCILVFLVLYIIFAIVVVRQVKLMTRTLEVGLEVPIRFVAYVHLGFSVFVFILSIFIL
jgi:hypothetical protein